MTHTLLLRTLLVTALIMLLCTGAMAQTIADTLRPVTRATLYGVGSANMFDTYLSPQEYRGVEIRILHERMRPMKWADGKISRTVTFQSYVNYTHNHVNNNKSVGALATWNYALHYNFSVLPGFKLLAGGAFDLNGGFLWNMRNGNNPASARAYANICASGMAVWDFHIKNRPFSLHYGLNLPLMGMMFSPEYGESYYEIFSLGNSKGVVKFTSLHNQPSLRQMLSLDFNVRKVKMRVAYMCDTQQSKVNNLKTHAYSHIFMLGFVKKFFVVR